MDTSSGVARHILAGLRSARTTRAKDGNIDKHMRRFIEEYSSRSLPEREREFRPEVLIPCFNHGAFVRAALSSAPDGIPVTVINDASTDDTPEILIELSKRFRFKLIDNEVSLLQTGSLNRAVAESTNNFFVILNADDVLLRYWVPTVLSVFAKYPSIRLAGGGSTPFCNEGMLRINRDMPQSLSYVPDARIFGREEAREYTRLNSINMTMSGCTFLRSAWNAVDGFWKFEDRVCSFDDRDFQMRVSALFDVAVLDEPSALYRTYSSRKRAQV